MPLIIPANSITGGYEVDNSLRFDDGSSDNLSKTFSTTGTSSYKATISLWLKRSTLGSKFVFGSYAGSPSVYSNDLYFTSGNALEFDFGNASQYALVTNQLFRDVSAWYHIVIAIDTTQATSSNRVKMYVNGTQITSFLTANYPTQNSVLMAFKNNNANRIGSAWNVGSPFDGYISEFVNIDGQQLDPTSFGEFDEDSSIWKPIDVSGLTFGTNGFYLPFKQANFLGTDESGNSNDFTVNNLTSIDQTTDTPTNNYCTLNPLASGVAIGGVGGNFTEGNTIFTGGSANWCASKGTFSVTQGKWYFEAKKITNANGTGNGANTVGIGYAELQNPLPNDNPQAGGSILSNILFLNDNGWTTNFASPSTQWSPAYGVADGDIVGIALDLDTNTYNFYINGSSKNSGSISGGYDGLGLTPAIVQYGGDTSRNFYFNFGNPPYSISSGNSDGNGYGNFEYAVPSGYYALNTKNLSEFG